MAEDPKVDRTNDRKKLAEMREDIIKEIGQEAYDKSGIKEIHDQEEGKLDVEDLNDDS